jgi:hypothetical protein
LLFAFTTIDDAKPARSVSKTGEIRPIRPKTSRIGRNQLLVRRRLIAAGKPLTTAELARSIYLPPLKHWHVTRVREAARRFAVEVGRRRSRGAPILWALRPYGR